MKTWCIFLSLLQQQVVTHSHVEAVLPPTTNASSNTNDKDLDQICRKMCRTYFETQLDMISCQPALNLIPRPTVYKSCVKGRKSGFEKICHPTCMGIGSKNDKDNHKIDVFPDSYTACKHETTKSSWSEKFDWCRKGYDLTFQETKSTISDFMIREHFYISDKRISSTENEIFLDEEKESSLVREEVIHNWNDDIQKSEEVEYSNKIYNMANDVVSTTKEEIGENDDTRSIATNIVPEPHAKSDNSVASAPKNNSNRKNKFRHSKEKISHTLRSVNN